ncbi:MAG: hypothetical protein ABI587_11695 [Gemmatimonadales bacterium]
MQDPTSSAAGQAEFPHGDILTRIALRRERFVSLIRRLTGASIDHAERVFRPLPFIDSRRGSKLRFGTRSSGLRLEFGGK